MRGGYQIIDFKGKSLSPTGDTVIEGIYDKIEGTNKACLLSNVNIVNSEKKDAFAYPEVSGGNYVFTAFGYKISVSDVDAVTIVLAQ